MISHHHSSSSYVQLHPSSQAGKTTIQIWNSKHKVNKVSPANSIIYLIVAITVQAWDASIRFNSGQGEKY